MKIVALAFALALATPAWAQQAPLPYKPFTVTSPDGVKLSVQEWGNPNGPAILFVHGYSQAYLSWMRQVTDPEMAKKFRMVTFDLRGHGNSDKPNDKAAYHENKRWADDVKAIIDELKLNKPVLVGWSYAGRVVSDYLMVHGESNVAGVNYVAAMTKAETNAGAPAGAPSGGMGNPDLITQTRSVAEFLRFCFEKQPDQKDFEIMVAFNQLTPAYVRALLGGRTTPYEAMLKGLKVPVLVTHGNQDKAVLKAASLYTAATVPGAKASYYEGIGHAPFWEDTPRFNKELTELVEQANRRM